MDNYPDQSQADADSGSRQRRISDGAEGARGTGAAYHGISSDHEGSAGWIRHLVSLSSSASQLGGGAIRSGLFGNSANSQLDPQQTRAYAGALPSFRQAVQGLVGATGSEGTGLRSQLLETYDQRGYGEEAQISLHRQRFIEGYWIDPDLFMDVGL